MKYIFFPLILLSAVVLAVVFSIQSTDKQNVDQSVNQIPLVVIEKMPEAPPSLHEGLHKTPSSIVLEAQPVSIRRLIKNGQTEAAIMPLEELFRKDPTNEGALLTLAKSYEKDENRRDKAEQILRQILESNPENREALERYLNLQLDRSRPGAPLESLRRLAEERPDSPGIAGAYARSLADKGKFSEAIALLERAIENPRADTMAFASLAELYLTSGEYLENRQIDRIENLINAIAAKDANHPSLRSLRDRLERRRLMSDT